MNQLRCTDAAVEPQRTIVIDISDGHEFPFLSVQPDPKRFRRDINALQLFQCMHSTLDHP